jgi:hypothetical protein
MMDRTSNTIAGIILMKKERAANADDNPKSGSSLRKKSTAILEVKGYVARKKSIMYTNRKTICEIRLAVCITVFQF